LQQCDQLLRVGRGGERPTVGGEEVGVAPGEDDDIALPQLHRPAALDSGPTRPFDHHVVGDHIASAAPESVHKAAPIGTRMGGHRQDVLTR